MKDHCRKVLQRAYLILDGEIIAEEERVEIEAHLEDCEPCFERYGIEVEMKRVVYRSCGSQSCPSDLKERISGLLRDA
jgi:mycothiol system anti-sigma-R factor